MKKDKTYLNTRFSAEVLREAQKVLSEISIRDKVKIDNHQFFVAHEDSRWHYDTIEEFLSAFRVSKEEASFSLYGNGYDLTVDYDCSSSTVRVKAATRATIETLFEVFEKNASSSALPEKPQPQPIKYKPNIFIGHGRNNAWRDLKDHLQDKHGFEVVAYESGARAGHSIRDILEEMVNRSSFAVLVMTGEDDQLDGQKRARQNVIHEAGLFQGKLGFSRAIILLEEGVEQFSNVQGVQYIGFSKNNIKETFGDVLATLRREFRT